MRGDVGDIENAPDGLTDSEIGAELADGIGRLLPDVTDFVLVDPDPDRLAAVGPVSARIIAAHDHPAEVSVLRAVDVRHAARPDLAEDAIAPVDDGVLRSPLARPCARVA